MDDLKSVTAGMCECGCGQQAPVAAVTSRRDGHVKGQPLRFVHGHNRRKPLLDRFWSFVDRRGDDACWPWLGGTFPDTGYGSFTYTTTVGGAPVTVSAHRFSYELHNGRLPRAGPKRVMVMHMCDNRVCVNPRHLRRGSHQANINDMVTKDRQAQGERFPHARLSNARVRQMREEYATGEYTTTTLATRYSVSATTISLIVRGRGWKKAGGPIFSRPRLNMAVTDDQVVAIRQRYATGLVSMSRLARHYRTTTASISRIVRGVQRPAAGWPRRAASPRAKITGALVLEMREAYACGSQSYRTIADRFGVPITAVAGAIRGDTWKHVAGPVQRRTRAEAAQRRGRPAGA